MNLKTRIELEALITEREGQIAENKYREILNEVVAYTEEDFSYIAARMRQLLQERPQEACPEILQIEKELLKRIEAKTGWGRNELKAIISDVFSGFTKSSDTNISNSDLPFD